MWVVMSDDDSDWGLMVAFTDDSPSFVNGFEAGIIWALLEAGQASIERTVHAENREVIERMARRMGYSCEFVETEVEGWLELVLTKLRPASHLSVVR